LFELLLLGTRGFNFTHQASNTINIPSVYSIQQHQQTEDGRDRLDNARLSREELATSTLSEGPSTTSTHDVPSSISRKSGTGE
jgi:hypothetical protein